MWLMWLKLAERLKKKENNVINKNNTFSVYIPLYIYSVYFYICMQIDHLVIVRKHYILIYHVALTTRRQCRSITEKTYIIDLD